MLGYIGAIVTEMTKNDFGNPQNPLKGVKGVFTLVLGNNLARNIEGNTLTLSDKGGNSLKIESKDCVFEGVLSLKMEVINSTIVLCASKPKSDEVFLGTIYIDDFNTVGSFFQAGPVLTLSASRFTVPGVIQIKDGGVAAGSKGTVQGLTVIVNPCIGGIDDDVSHLWIHRSLLGGSPVVVYPFSVEIDQVQKNYLPKLIKTKPEELSEKVYMFLKALFPLNLQVLSEEDISKRLGQKGLDAKEINSAIILINRLSGKGFFHCVKMFGVYHYVPQPCLYASDPS